MTRSTRIERCASPLVSCLPSRDPSSPDASFHRYYEGGVSSVYLWTPEDTKDQFAGVVLLKKGSSRLLTFLPLPSLLPPVVLHLEVDLYYCAGDRLTPLALLPPPQSSLHPPPAPGTRSTSLRRTREVEQPRTSSPRQSCFNSCPSPKAGKKTSSWRGV